MLIEVSAPARLWAKLHTQSTRRPRHLGGTAVTCFTSGGGEATLTLGLCLESVGAGVPERKWCEVAPLVGLRGQLLAWRTPHKLLAAFMP